MYHAIVRQVIHGAFAGLNAGRTDGVTRLLSPGAEHRFLGTHALGGQRHTAASIERWYQRLLTVFPHIHFDIQRIQVSGWPWNTLAVVEWNETNTGADGIVNRNQGVNIIELKWGKVHRISIYTDTAVLQDNLQRLGAANVTEATAAPIIDD